MEIIAYVFTQTTSPSNEMANEKIFVFFARFSTRFFLVNMNRQSKRSYFPFEIRNTLARTDGEKKSRRETTKEMREKQN